MSENECLKEKLSLVDSSFCLIIADVNPCPVEEWKYDWCLTWFRFTWKEEKEKEKEKAKEK